MFEEMYKKYLQEQQQINNYNSSVNAEHQYHDYAVRIIASIDVEVTLYAREPSLPLQDNQQNFSCPLTWWKLNQSKYKMLSEDCTSYASRLPQPLQKGFFQ